MGNESNIRLIAGLGNPGDEYRSSRHNIGFMAVERLLAKMPKGMEKIHIASSFVWKGVYAGRPLLMQTPLTYMNLSGEAIAPLMRSEGIKPSELLVIHDDMDLPLGRMRIRKNGSSGGHNGIKSIIEHLGSEDFARLRIGIGHSAKKSNTVDFVLSGFEGDDAELVSKMLDSAADAAILIMRRGFSVAMNGFNSLDLTPKESDPAEPLKQNEDSQK